MDVYRVNWLRRTLLELWGITLLAVVVGFLGPFGTYVGTSLVERVSEWAGLLFGAYIIVRPWIWGLQRVSRLTSLPAGPLILWGVVAISLPLAMVWRSVGQDAYRALDGYAELLPFALLCAVAVLGVTRWARAANHRFAAQVLEPAGPPHRGDMRSTGAIGDGDAPTVEKPIENGEVPRLLARLSPGFQAPIIALQSEDHYVRVHGRKGSELILIRLRDAIVEMAGVPGEQVHRSWWIAREGVIATIRAGRGWSLRLVNGELAPIARESVYRLRRSGFLAEDVSEAEAADIVHREH
jgi:hypothetical protein